MKKSSSAIPERLRPFLRIGTCSWKYDSWKGLIYDAGKSYRPDDYLGDYARRLNSVEVDQWFWSLFPGSIRLPEPRVVRRYAESVPDDFVFTVKAPNALTLTHFYAKKEAGTGEFAGKPNGMFLNIGLLEKFLDRLSPLDKKLGPIMFQFEYLNRQKMASKEAFFEAFGAFIEKAPKGFAYALETRNPNYLSSALFDFLKERRVGFVYLDGYYMPPIGEVFDKFAAAPTRSSLTTESSAAPGLSVPTESPVPATFNIIRLHGGDRKEIEKETGERWDKIVAPKPAALQAAARITVENIRKKIVTYVNVNNHFEGSAPLTIDRFLKTLADERG